MKQPWTNTHVVLAMICLVSVALKAQGGEGFRELTLELGTEQPSVLPLEPLSIAISLFNNTGRPVTGHTMIEPNGGFLDIYVAKGGERFELFRTADWPTARRATVGPPPPLKPGQVHTVGGYLYYAHAANPDKEKGHYLLPEPGIYRLKAILKDVDTEQTIESNILTIQATQPVGQDAGAYEFIRGLPDLYFLMGGGEAAKLEELVSRFPDSRYARYADYALGMLEKAASYDDFFLADDALGKLVETSLKQGNLQKAKAYFATLKAKFPTSPQIRAAQYKLGNR